MNHMKVAEARARFGELLDEAEQGRPVFIERRGIRFKVVAEPARRSSAQGDPLFEFVDPAVSEGLWSWKNGPRGLAFSRRKRR